MLIDQTSGPAPGSWLAWALRAPLSPRTWAAAGYLLASMAVGIFWFVVLVTGISVGLSLVIIWVGIPILAATMLAWRGGAWLERRWIRLALGVDIPDPYRPLAHGGLWHRLHLLATDPATWKDLVYLALLFPLGILWFVVTATLWAGALTLLTTPLFYWIPSNGTIEIDLYDDPGRTWLVIDDLPKALAAAAVGLLLCVVAAVATRGMAAAQAAIAQGLLGPSQAQLRARVDTLRASRDRAVDAAEAERRRIERDLHDGAQQRLVALAMDLGMAREKLRSDPEAATALVGEAHEEAKRALAELRDLARGIHPAVLADRGLDAAISALAARAPFPVSVQVTPERLPGPVESTAYFVVAEALTNAVKHGRARDITVRIARDGDLLLVQVTDDGVGGAEPERGSGLRGLADRVAAIGGRFAVRSPEGGPTVVSAELPCGS
jgi:signal transduction histidine kinase